MLDKILIIEDEQELLEALAEELSMEGYKVISAKDGEIGLEKAQKNYPDLIILDIMLPKIDGYTVCRRLREKGNKIPILMLTAKGMESDKVAGFEFGADDYVTKPFGLRELLARVKALLRRTREKTGELNGYTINDIKVDFKKHIAWKGRKQITFTTTEIQLLQYLISHKEEVITRERLFDAIWGFEEFPTTRTIDTHILNLRKKLEKNPNNPKHILTIHGEGYKFVV